MVQYLENRRTYKSCMHVCLTLGDYSHALTDLANFWRFSHHVSLVYPIFIVHRYV